MTNRVCKARHKATCAKPDDVTRCAEQQQTSEYAAAQEVSWHACISCCSVVHAHTLLAVCVESTLARRLHCCVMHNRCMWTRRFDTPTCFSQNSW